MINHVIAIQENSAVSAATAGPDWPLSDGKTVDALVLIEGITQTAAIGEGYKRKQRGAGAVKGWLAGIKNAAFYEERIPLNTNRVILLENKDAFDNYGVIEGTVKTGEKILATAVLQAVRLNDNNQ